MKAGAVGFLTKPFRQQDLLDAVQQAIGRDRAARDLETKLASLRVCYELLTPQREVTACVVLGMLNKQIAAELGTTEKTIKFHRGRIMHKMMAKSLADLVRMAGHLGLPGQRS
jgi:FixJ family two-component response regulator